jgi:hypothetical protein
MEENLECKYCELSKEPEINISGHVDGFGICSNGICHTVNIASNTIIDGPCSFENCGNLTTVNFGQNVLITANNTFIGCSSLTTLNASSNGLRLFGNGTFARCGFRVLIIPTGTIFDKDYSFGECLGLVSVVIKDRVKFIGNDTFNNCSNLSIVHIGSNVEFLGDRTFANCERLETLRIGNDVSILGEDNFSGCRNISTSTHGDNLVFTDESFIRNA